MDDKGYLFFPGFLDRESVISARRLILESLRSEGALASQSDMDEAVARPGFRSDFQSENERFPQVQEVVFAESVRRFFDAFLGGESRPLDHIWLRIKSPGRSTAPHCDIVYMGRGTQNLFTIWVPMGDIPLELGPLMILEGSHRVETLREGYCRMDIDDNGNWKKWRFRHGGFFKGGQYTKNPVGAQKELGGRWLTADFKMGDLAVFSTYTLHGSIDNRTDQIRISADARYQLASDPVDDRWVKSASNSSS